MILFIDLRHFYFVYAERSIPLCAFLSTSDDKFIRGLDGMDVFHDMEGILECKQGERMASLVPDGFFAATGRESLVRAAASAFARLSDAERLELMRSYCVHCGCDDPRCMCSRDD